MLKDGRNLRKMIEPSATIHRAKDKDVMKKAVSDVKNFIHRLPNPTLSQEIHDDFDIAYELIMVEKRSIPNPERPTLNTEDL